MKFMGHRIAYAIAAAFSALSSFAGIPVVAIPDTPTAAERFAASELAGELGKCLGAAPEIVAESDIREGRASARPCLYVGATKTAKKAWRETTSSADIENRFMSLRRESKTGVPVSAQTPSF